MAAELTGIVEEVLGVPTLGGDAEFVASGGDCIAATLCANRIRRRFNCDVPAAWFLDGTMTIAKLERLVAGAAAPVGGRLMGVRQGTPPPIFILAHGRWGSTLLRCLLHAHADVCCSPEIELGKPGAALAHTLKFTSAPVDRKQDPMPDATRRALRRQLLHVIKQFCASQGKNRYCDKSITNLAHTTSC